MEEGPGISAGRAVGLQPGQQVNASEFHKIFKCPEVKPHHKVLLRVFVTKAAWSDQFMHDVGCDVSPQCVHCRALQVICIIVSSSASATSRSGTYFSEEELEWLRHT